MDFFQGLHVRTKIVVIVAVMFFAIAAVVLPFIFIRNRVLFSSGKNRLANGDFAGAFDAFKSLLKCNFGDEGIGSNPLDSLAEQAIASLTQLVANSSIGNAFQQVVNSHRQIVSLKKKASAANDKQRKKLEANIELVQKRGIQLLNSLEYPNSNAVANQPVQMQSEFGYPPVDGANLGSTGAGQNFQPQPGNPMPGNPVGFPQAQNPASIPVIPVSPVNQPTPSPVPQNTPVPNPIPNQSPFPIQNPVPVQNPIPNQNPASASHQTLGGVPTANSQLGTTPNANPANSASNANPKIQFLCVCGKKLSGPSTLSGKTIKCPACQTALIVP